MLMTGLILAGAVLVDLWVGDPPNRFHPVAWMGAFIGWAGRQKWRFVSGAQQEQAQSSADPTRASGAGAAQAEARSTREFWFGAGLVIGGMLLFGLPMLAVNALPTVMKLIVGIVGLKLVLSVRGLAKAGAEIGEALDRGDLVRGRRLVGYHLVSRATGDLSAGQVVSATIESLADNITDNLTSVTLRAPPIFA